MDVKNTQAGAKEKKRSQGGRIGAYFEKRRGDTVALWGDVIAFVVAITLTRTHLFFGARPAGLAFIAALPTHVLPALLGLFIGAVSLGEGGFILAIGGAVCLSLRILLAGGRRGGGGLFCEAVPLRASAGIIGAFVVGVYEILLRGFSMVSALYGAATVLATGLLTLLFSALFVKKLDLPTFIYGETVFLTDIPKLRSREGLLHVAFCLSLSTYLAILVLGLSPYSVFGISLGTVFSAAVTLFFARRFGPLYAMAAGFLSALPLSAVNAAAFSLAGLAAGLLFPFGAGFALGGSALVAGLFSFYAGGVSGLLSLLPEYLVGEILIAPAFRRLKPETKVKGKTEENKLASDMVGTMALCYKTRCDGTVGRVCDAMGKVVPLLSEFAAGCPTPAPDAYRTIVCDALDLCCKTCRLYPVCGDGGKSVLVEQTVGKLIAGEGISISDLGACCGGVAEKCNVLDVIRRRVAALELSHVRENGGALGAAFVGSVSALFSEARATDERARSVDRELSDRLSSVFSTAGLSGGVIRAFGDRQKTVFAAATDPGGDRLSSSAFLSSLEAALGAKVEKPAYYKREDTVLLECRTRAKFKVESATASLPSARAGEISGDSVRCFESEEGGFFVALSDGMGTGKEARQAADFCTGVLSSLLGAGASEGSALALLNDALRAGGEERGATVDLFLFDRFTGEGRFIKSGAAPSYVKRGNSLYRVRSQTVPIGVIGKPDAEKIRVEVEPGDLIVMVSDGVSASPEDAPWLMELLSSATVRSLSDFAESILRAARLGHPERWDDMSVVVLRVSAA